MIIDAFLYAGEVEMAELRRRTLGPYVDAQVAVSASLTYQGAQAPLYDAPRGVPGVRVVVDPSPEPFGIEAQHRSGLPQVVAACLLPPLDAVLLVSDVDEIPDPTTLDEIAAAAKAGPVQVPMRMHAFALDYLYPLRWWGTTASLFDEADPHRQRSVQRAIWPEAGHGWHLSWMGTPAQRARKLATFSHPELADVDLDECWRTATHVTGHPLRRLAADEMAALDWPAPLFDGFDTPEDWRAP